MLPTTATPHIAQSFPLLLHDFDKMCVKSASYTPSKNGFSPLNRPIEEYIKYGVINLDKTSGPSSHEVVSWVKRMLPHCEKTGHSGTLDPPVTGNLLICLNRATRLVKSQQEMGKKYVSILQFNDFSTFINKIGKDEFKKRCVATLKTLIAPQLQRPPTEGCAVKCVLRLREIYNITFLECDLQNGRLLFTVDCESGTYIRSLCYHIGLLVGCEAFMLELRRIRSGFLTEKTNMVTLHQVLDASWMFNTTSDESYLRKIVMPLEFLLIKEKLIIIKDSAVAAVCHGASVLLQGVIRYSANIDNGDRVVIATTKGEAVALATATMNSADIAGLNHGVAAQPTRVIMDRDLYDKSWGKGPLAIVRKKLITEGSLGKRGQIIDGKTPETYINRYTDVQEFLKQAGDTCANTLFDKEALDFTHEKHNLQVIDSANQAEKTDRKKHKKDDDEKPQKEKKEHKHSKEDKHKDKKHQ